MRGSWSSFSLFGLVGLECTDRGYSLGRIHSRKMQVSKKVNFEELSRSTDEFNGAQLKVSLAPRDYLTAQQVLTIFILGCVR